MKNKPYDKKNNVNSLGSDLTIAIQNFHYAGEQIENTDDEKIHFYGGIFCHTRLCKIAGCSYL